MFIGESIKPRASVVITFMHNDAEHQVTYHGIWQNPVTEISHNGFVQLDLVLCPTDALWQVKQIRSDRWQALASHHFLLEGVVEIEACAVGMNSADSTRNRPRYDLAALKEPPV